MKNADIIISATGSRHTVNVGNNSIYNPTIIDVGINTDENGKLCGDVDYNSIVQDCYAITPVPGGVGPMTVISLMENVVKAWDIQCRPISQ
jgi:methylenetetrahydrofolate dehydrogenase (NADP+)/methenyltetrahydrofolate cyclohydrolase